MSSFKAVAIIDGKQRNLLRAEYTFYKLRDITGNPTTTARKTPIYLMFESTGFDDDLYYYMFSPTKSFSGEIIFYDRDLLKTLFKVEFHKAYVVGLEERFDHNDNLPLHINLAITCGAIKARDAKKIEKWVPEDPFKEVAPTVIEEVEEETEEQEEKDLKFIASLERLDSYQGEFGFDWMRDNYNEICKDYAKLKKEYTPTTIEGREYFVPWLSMFPNQKNVTLKLSITELKGKAKDTDIIKLPSKDGVKFEPNEFKVSEAHGKEINIICESPLNDDIVIELLNKDDNTVGMLNILKNSEEHILPIQFVKILGDEENNTYNERTFAQSTSQTYNNLKNDLKNKYFNQALIKLDILPMKELTIDTDSFAEKNLLTLKFNQDGTKGIPNYKKGFDKELYKMFVKDFGNFKGIIVFLSAIQQSGLELGHAKPYPRDNNYLIIVPSSITNSLTISHEIAHTLGLYHAWSSSDLYKERELAIRTKQNEIKEWLNKYKEYPDDTKIGNTTETLSQRREEYNNWLEKLEKEKNDKTDLSNPLIAFQKASTENIMDYNGYTTTDGKTIHNPFSEGTTFWQWQWRIMQYEVKQYHGK